MKAFCCLAGLLVRSVNGLTRWGLRLAVPVFLRVCPVAFLPALSSCTDESLAYQGPNRGNGHRGESGVFDPSMFGTIKPKDAGEGDHIYLCGVRYPDGYDWHKDAQKGSVECTLFLLRDGECVLELPVGVAHNLSSDSDMHRIVGGKLYTEYSTDTESIVACNGEELYRAPGRERLRGMVLKNNDFYTLCEARDARRWILRRDGAVYLEGEGNILHDLAVDDGTMEGRSMTGGMTDPKLFFVTQSGTTLTFWEDARSLTSVEVPSARKAYAAGMMDGTLWYACSEGEYKRFRDITRSCEMTAPLSGSSDYAGNGNCVYQLSGNAVSLDLYCLRPQAPSNRLFTCETADPFALCVNQQEDAYADAWAFLIKEKEHANYCVYTRSQYIALPEGLVPYSRRHFGYLGSRLMISLVQDGQAVLFCDGQYRRYRFNGYIDGWGYGK